MKGYKTLASCIVVLGCASSIPARAADDAKQFIGQSIRANWAEEEVGELAQTHSSSKAVRAFGAMLKDDHAKANQNAMTAAMLVGTSANVKSNFLQQMGYRKLSILSGTQFDIAFVDDMLKHHDIEVKQYEQQLNSPYPAAAAYAKAMLPSLKKHLKTAQELQAMLAGIK